MNSKCVHVVITPDYQPELCAITLPLLKHYAERIHADFNEITTRKFPDYPVAYECMQIYEAGKDYDWNLLLHADMLAGPMLEDFTALLPPERVGVCMRTDPRQLFEIASNPYFKRDGRYFGLVDMAIGTSSMTHDLWTPLPGPYKDYEQVFLSTNISKSITQFCLSQNLARFGLTAKGLFPIVTQLFHAGREYNSGPSARAQQAKQKLDQWGVVRPTAGQFSSGAK